MPGDYIPRPDADFNAWQQNFITYANANLAALGLVAGDLTPVTTLQLAWTIQYPAHITAQANAQSARATKDATRVLFEAAIRPLVARLQASPSVNDGERPPLGITIGADPQPIGPPTTHPVVKVECGARLQHTISFTDSATPTKKAKPAGVLGAEIWMALTAVGAPTPTDPATFAFVALDTRTPYVNDFGGADGGKNAHYLLRWVNPTGQKGPWSETATATIGV